MSKKTSTVLALVLRYHRGRERDLLVTLATREYGKITVAAKGVARLCSSKRPCLEIGNLAKVHLVETKGLPLLTQANVVSDTRAVRADLSSLRKFLLFMEILDRLLVSEELSPQFFHQLLYLRELFLQKVSNHTIRLKFAQVLQDLGFTHAPAPISISQQVSALFDQKLYSFEYLRVPT